MAVSGPDFDSAFSVHCMYLVWAFTAGPGSDFTWLGFVLVLVWYLSGPVLGPVLDFLAFGMVLAHVSTIMM